jgi:hypothetical protein
MIAAIMGPRDARRHPHHLSHPPVAAAPASGASYPGGAGGTRRLDISADAHGMVEWLAMRREWLDALAAEEQPMI